MRGTVFSFLVLVLVAMPLQASLQSKVKKPYLSLYDSDPAAIAASFVQSMVNSQKIEHLDKKALLAEANAIWSIIEQYDYKAKPHKTDGWSNFQEAEWPFMTLIYAGLSYCQLAKTYPEQRKLMEGRVKTILKNIKTPAVTGFMEDHFGKLFPKSSIIKTPSTFIHGHYLYLAIQARKDLGLKDDDAMIHLVAKSLVARFKEKKVLRSYSNMYYLTDNFSSLAALKKYDQLFLKNESSGIAKTFISELKNHYMDSYSGLFATYGNIKRKSITIGPRGISVMYGLIFLPEFDKDFAKDQWKQIRKFMLMPMSKILAEQNKDVPLVSMASTFFKDYDAVLEHPYNEKNTTFDKNFSDGDSGPVILGIGPSASGFAVAASIKNGDMEAYKRICLLANKIGGASWDGDKLFYKNMMHEVGQAVVLYGKSLNTKKK